MQVVCPLIALAKDQVENALVRNIDAEMFNSEVQVIVLQPLCNHGSNATPQFLGLHYCQLPVHHDATAANAMLAC